MLWTVPLLALLSAPLVYLIGQRVGRGGLTLLTVLVLSATLALAVTTLAGDWSGLYRWNNVLILTLELSTAGRVFMLTVPAVALPILIFAGYHELNANKDLAPGGGAGGARLLALLLAFVGAMELLVLAGDLLTLLIAWELVAAFLTVVPKIGASVALARFVSLLPPEMAWSALVAFISVVTMTLGNLAALRQTDVRRLLGWSSVSQSGYGLMAIVVMDASDGALPALMVFLASYAGANLAAFAAVTHLRGRTALEDYQGLARKRPLAAVVLILSLLSLVGTPPLVGFFGKLMLFKVTLEGGYGWLAVVAAINTVISLFYYLRVIGPMVFGAGLSPVHVLLGHWSRTAMVLAGLSLVVGGLGAGMLLDATATVRFALL